MNEELLIFIQEGSIIPIQNIYKNASTINDLTNEFNLIVAPDSTN